MAENPPVASAAVYVDVHEQSDALLKEPTLLRNGIIRNFEDIRDAININREFLQDLCEKKLINEDDAKTISKNLVDGNKKKTAHSLVLKKILESGPSNTITFHELLGQKQPRIYNLIEEGKTEAQADFYDGALQMSFQTMAKYLQFNSSLLITELVSKKIMTVDEMELVEVKDTKLAKSTELFKILLAKADKLPEIVDIFRNNSNNQIADAIKKNLQKSLINLEKKTKQTLADKASFYC